MPKVPKLPKMPKVNVFYPFYINKKLTLSCHVLLWFLVSIRPASIVDKKDGATCLVVAEGEA